MTKILEEKECLEANGRAQEQRTKLLEENFRQQCAEADKWLSLSREYLDAKILANQNEERLIKQVKELTCERDKLAEQTEESPMKQIEELTRKCDKLKTKVQNFEEEKNELDEGWKSVVKHHQAQKDEWVR